MFNSFSPVFTHILIKRIYY